MADDVRKESKFSQETALDLSKRSNVEKKTPTECLTDNKTGVGKFSLGKRKSSGDDKDGGSSVSLTHEPKKKIIGVQPIKMSLGNSATKCKEPMMPARKVMTVAAAFGDDSDSEPEDMPAEAKMRMKNVGRETPTAAGPNSFGKTKFGFCDTQRMHERLLKDASKEVDG